MRTRYKILLVTVTLVIGTLTLLHSRDDNDAILRLRSFFSNRALSTFDHSLPAVTNGTSVWYSGIALFSIIMIVLVFRAARRGGSRRLRGGRLIELKPPKIPAAKFRAREVAAKTDVESLLRQELKRITELLQTKDSSIRELANDLAGKQQLLQKRSEELDGYKSKADSLTEQLTDLTLAKERTESILQKELKKTEVLQAKDFDGAEQESAITETVRALEKELSEKQEILQTRTTGLKVAKSKINTLRERLAAMGSAKKQTEDVLQQQLKQKTELLQAKDAAMKELQESSTATAQALEQRLNEKEKLSKDRAEELKAFGFDSNTPTEWGPGRKRAKSLLLQELQNRTERLQAKEIIVRELEGRLNATVRALENARDEVQRLTNQRNAESPDRPTKNGSAKEQAEGLRQSDRKGMNSKLLELGAAKARAASLEVEKAKEVRETDNEWSEERNTETRKKAD